MTKTTKTNIDPQEWYSLQDIVNKRMFKFCPKSFWSVRNIVALDQRNDNILKARVTGTGRGTKYQFKGENIISLINLVEEGKAKLS